MGYFWNILISLYFPSHIKNEHLQKSLNLRVGLVLIMATFILSLYYFDKLCFVLVFLTFTSQPLLIIMELCTRLAVF